MSRGKVIGERDCAWCGARFDVWQASKDQRVCSRSCSNEFRWSSGVYGPKAEESFWARVDKDGPTPIHRPEMGPCWLWTGKIDANGYGRAYGGAKGRQMGAHRRAWELATGDSLATSMHVMHRCDNRPCVRPSHLEKGTAADNIHDMITKGRHSAQARITSFVVTYL